MGRENILMAGFMRLKKPIKTVDLKEKRKLVIKGHFGIISEHFFTMKKKVMELEYKYKEGEK